MDIELEERSKAPLETSHSERLPGLHAAAQHGRLDEISALIARPDACDVAAHDNQNATALHWAAINGHVDACRILIDAGAPLDARGGQLEATPLHWAARNGHIYVVHELLLRGANARAQDGQDFNILHLAVHSSSAYLVAYVLFTRQPLSVDSRDAEGHTPLHWACYQGDQISIDLLLDAGADPCARDNHGFTALHWAVVRGDAACICALFSMYIKHHGGALESDPEAGSWGCSSWLEMADNRNRNPFELATELKTVPALQAGLDMARLDRSGRPREPRRAVFRSIAQSDRKFNVLLFCMGFEGCSAVLLSMAIFPAWAIVCAIIGVFGVQQAVFNALVASNRRVIHSPYCFGILASTLVHLAHVYATRLLQWDVWAYIGILCFAAVSYTLVRGMMADPGYIPRPDPHLARTVLGLCDTMEFNDFTFCLVCKARRPMRARHSSASDRCIALYDHYCPWTWNDVGLKNHREFVVFLGAMTVGLVLAVSYLLRYIDDAEVLPDVSGCIVPDALCSVIARDTYGLATLVWSCIQLVWVPLLLGLQLWQVARQMTTAEVTAVSRFGFMGAVAGPAPVRARTQGPPCASLLRLLGFDRLLSGSATGLVRPAQVTNPFDRGVLTNCVDFWTLGGALRVNYMELKDVP